MDQQFADVVSMLERRGLLENAIVVVYSDHGESFEAPHESLVPDGDPLIEALRLKPTWGHGTTVLTAHQYRIVLGMRRYGRDHARWPGGREVAAPVSFEDIAPTMVEALSAPTEAHFDGQSLLPCSSSAPAPNTHSTAASASPRPSTSRRDSRARAAAYRRARCTSATGISDRPGHRSNRGEALAAGKSAHRPPIRGPGRHAASCCHAETRIAGPRFSRRSS